MQGVIDNFLKPKFISLGMNATGTWLNSLEAQAENGIGYIKGKDYTIYLVNGRAGGKRPPVQPLITWVGAKLGIQGKQGVGIAHAIANKIAKEGTDYYPEGTDLLEVLTTQEVYDYVYENFATFVRVQTVLEIKRRLKNTLDTV